jgi:hypothetical protein
MAGHGFHSNCTQSSVFKRVLYRLLTFYLLFWDSPYLTIAVCITGVVAYESPIMKYFLVSFDSFKVFC